ncbi:MAG: 30S ribosomal protein S17 [Candidatus Zambryskibacteria bacterium]|nr:30S ribosomal protein S17 [Candidatus Zambryskibacteria bacterium]
MDKKIEKTEEKKNGIRSRILKGIVVSDKMKDTCTVSVIRFVKHKKYRKYYKVNKKYKTHDIGNTKKIGDKVEIKEVKPISKDKHFIIIK